MAEIRARQEQDRAEARKLHEENQEVRMQQALLMQQQSQTQALLMELLGRFQPGAALALPMPPPILGNVGSVSGTSGSSAGQSLPVEEPRSSPVESPSANVASSPTEPP